jgi:hypothetical protein
LTITLRVLSLIVAVFATSIAGSGECLPSSNPGRQGFDNDWLDRIVPVRQSHVNAERISGAFMAIARNGRLVYSDVVGYAESRPNGRWEWTQSSVFTP